MQTNSVQEKLSALAEKKPPLEVQILEFSWRWWDFLSDAFAFAFIIVFGYILYVTL